MEIQKLLIGQLRDHVRIPARLVSVRSIREQRIEDHTVKHALRRGKRPLHLIIHHAVVGELPVRLLQLITPALLAEDLLVAVYIWVKYGVHIYMHQILKVLLIAARHRIDRLIRIGHGI